MIGPFEDLVATFAGLSRGRAAAVVAGGIAVIAAIDFLAGVELRTYPLYYGPIAVAGWHFSRRGALVAALLSAAGWFGSNQLAGMEFSHPSLWLGNTVVQAASFAIVGLMIARLRSALDIERVLARRDPVCQLLNRRAFYEEATRLARLCRRHGRPVTLAYLDLDHFKTVNDRLGHAAGDDLLRTIAQVIERSVRSADVAARLGGDEFALLLPELGEREAERALERLRAAIDDVLRPVMPGLGVSVGAIVFTDVDLDMDEMVRRADELMYAAKHAGRNRVRLLVTTADVAAPPRPAL